MKLRGSAATEPKNRKFDDEIGPLGLKSLIFRPPAKSPIFHNLPAYILDLQTDRIDTGLAKYIKIINNLLEKIRILDLNYRIQSYDRKYGRKKQICPEIWLGKLARC